MTFGIFWLVLVCGAAEAIAQYFWLGIYFRTGIPLCVVDVRYDEFSEIGACATDVTGAQGKWSHRSIDARRFALRQARYGIARYAYMHGVATVDPSSRSCRAIVYVDYNPLLVGAFFGTVAIGESVANAVVGGGITWLLLRVMTDRNAVRSVAQEIVSDRPVAGEKRQD